MVIRHAITVVLCLLVFAPQHVCTCHDSFADTDSQNRDTISPPAEPCHCHEHDSSCGAEGEPDFDSAGGATHHSHPDCPACECGLSWEAIEAASVDPPNLALDDIALTQGDFVRVRPCASIRPFAVKPPSVPRYLALQNLRI